MRRRRHRHRVLEPPRGGRGRGPIPVIAEVAERHNVNVAQVLLASNLQLGDVALSKSVTLERIRANLEAVSLCLSDKEMDAIAKLDRGERIGPDPTRFSYAASASAHSHTR